MGKLRKAFLISFWPISMMIFLFSLVLTEIENHKTKIFPLLISGLMLFLDFSDFFQWLWS